MKQTIYYISILFFLGCQSNDKSDKHVSTDTEKARPLLFNDMISDSLSDSAKIDIIVSLVNRIDTDTTLTIKNFSDTSKKNITTYYRNDTLVKIITGIYSGTSYDTIPNMTTHDYYTYYFFMDTLISLRYECNNYQNTGMCNPVFISSKFYLYNDQIIGQTHRNEIGQYGRCGCLDYSFTKKSDRILKYIRIIISDVDRLKEIINYR